MDSTVKEGRFQGGQGGQARRASLEEVEGSMSGCTNQQPPQRGGAVPSPVWVGSKWLLAFPRVPVTPGTPPLCSFRCIYLSVKCNELLCCVERILTAMVFAVQGHILTVTE